MMILFNRIPWDVVFGGCIRAMYLHADDCREAEFLTTRRMIAFSLDLADALKEFDDVTIVLVTRRWASAYKV